MSLLTVVVPCYNEEENVPFFYGELMKNEPFFDEKGIELELLYVDDGSRDGTVTEVKKLREKDQRVHLVSFSRNFGKEAAIYAGLENAGGDYVVLLPVYRLPPYSARENAGTSRAYFLSLFLLFLKFLNFSVNWMTLVSFCDIMLVQIR